ncbi:hypothetical protein ACSW8S_15930 (plasmid) [Clostridium perfringens]
MKFNSLFKGMKNILLGPKGKNILLASLIMSLLNFLIPVFLINFIVDVIGIYYISEIVIKEIRDIDGNNFGSLGGVLAAKVIFGLKVFLINLSVGILGLLSFFLSPILSLPIIIVLIIVMIIVNILLLLDGYAITYIGINNPEMSPLDIVRQSRISIKGKRLPVFLYTTIINLILVLINLIVSFPFILTFTLFTPILLPIIAILVVTISNMTLSVASVIIAHKYLKPLDEE